MSVFCCGDTGGNQNYWCRNRLEAAQEAAEALLSSPAVVPLQALTANTGLALIAVQRWDIVAAAEQYAAVEPQRGTMLAGWIANVDHLLALLSEPLQKKLALLGIPWGCAVSPCRALNAP